MPKGWMILLLGLSILTAGTGWAGERYGKQKVVYHINFGDPKAQTAALVNIQNHINAVGAENLDLKVVLNGDGLSLLVLPEAVKRTKMSKGNATEGFQGLIARLRKQHITFLICANTLKGKQIDYKTDLFEVKEEDVVPSGVAEAARLQLLGHAYIKP